MDEGFGGEKERGGRSQVIFFWWKTVVLGDVIDVIFQSTKGIKNDTEVVEI